MVLFTAADGKKLVFTSEVVMKDYFTTNCAPIACEANSISDSEGVQYLVKGSRMLGKFEVVPYKG